MKKEFLFYTAIVDEETDEVEIKVRMLKTDYNNNDLSISDRALINLIKELKDYQSIYEALLFKRLGIEK